MDNKSYSESPGMWGKFRELWRIVLNATVKPHRILRWKSIAFEIHIGRQVFTTPIWRGILYSSMYSILKLVSSTTITYLQRG